MYDKTVRRRRAVLALLVACSLILLTAYFTESDGGGLHSVQRGVFAVVSPIQDVASRALKPFRDGVNWVGDTVHAKSRVKNLKTEVNRLRARQINDDQLIRDNQNFRNELDLDTNVGLTSMGLVNVRVSGIDPSLWFSQVFISSGSDSGIRVGDPVIDGSGLVGKISAAESGSAVVQLITDHNFGATARIAASQVTGTVQPAVGNPDDIEMIDTGKATVTVGQSVVTAGLGSKRLRGHFPPGIPIGSVTRVENPQTDSQLVHIRPFADVRRLNYIQVVTKAKTS